jgi:hypothetical protein
LVSLLSIFPVRDDYRMKMQCAKQRCLPEDIKGEGMPQCLACYLSAGRL